MKNTQHADLEAIQVQGYYQAMEELSSYQLEQNFDTLTKFIDSILYFRVSEI